MSSQADWFSQIGSIHVTEVFLGGCWVTLSRRLFQPCPLSGLVVLELLLLQFVLFSQDMVDQAIVNMQDWSGHTKVACSGTWSSSSV